MLELGGDAAQYRAMWRDAEQLAQTSTSNIERTVKYSSLAIVAALAAVGAAALAAFVQFESSFAGIRKTVNATEDEFKKLETAMLEMSKRIPVNVNELNKIGEAAGQLGIKTKNIEKFTDTMAKLGVATNLTGDQAATQLARMANIMQMPQENFDRLGSTIVALGNNLATTEAEITSMALRISGAGKQIGLSEAQVLGFAGALSSVGIEAEAGGSAISKIMVNIGSAVNKGGAQLGLFASVANKTGEDFAEMWKKDATGALLAFIEGLDRSSKAGVNLFGILESLEITEVRTRDALLRAANAGELFRNAIQIGSRAWVDNNALTKEADQRFKTLESQFTKLYNTVKVFFILVGQELAPVLQVLLDGIASNINATNGWQDVMRTTADVLKTAFILTIGAAADIFYDFQNIILYGQIALTKFAQVVDWLVKAGQVGFLTLGAVVEAVFRGIQRVVITGIYGFRAKFTEFLIWAREAQINVAEFINKMKPGHYDAAWFAPLRKDIIEMSQTLIQLDKDKNAALEGTTNTHYEALQKGLAEFEALYQGMEEGTDEYSISIKKIREELAALQATGVPSENLLKRLTQVMGYREEMSDYEKAWWDIAAGMAKANEQTRETIALNRRLMPDVQQLLQSIKYSWEDKLVDLGKYNAMLKEGAITTEEYNRAVHKLGLKGAAENPFEAQLLYMKELDAQQKAGILSANEYALAMRTSLMTSEFMQPATTGIAESDKMIALQSETERMELEFKTQHELAIKYQSMTQKQLEAMNRNYNMRQMNFEYERKKLVLQSAMSIGESLLEITEGLAGKQSGIYKVMFAASKAFAIAEAIVKIQQGIANAASLPWPANLGAMASVAAATASIVSNIQAVKMASFEGGGLTPNRARSGGMDGKGGFVAMLHPNEKVVDLTRDQSGGSGEVTVNVNNYTDATATVERSSDGRTIDVIIKRTKAEIAAGIRTGGSDVAQAIEQTFRLRRA